MGSFPESDGKGAERSCQENSDVSGIFAFDAAPASISGIDGGSLAVVIVRDVEHGELVRGSNGVYTANFEI